MQSCFKGLFPVKFALELPPTLAVIYVLGFDTFHLNSSTGLERIHFFSLGAGRDLPDYTLDCFQIMDTINASLAMLKFFAALIQEFKRSLP